MCPSEIDWETQSQCVKCREVFNGEDKHICGQCKAGECIVMVDYEAGPVQVMKSSEIGKNPYKIEWSDCGGIKFNHCPICGTSIDWDSPESP